MTGKHPYDLIEAQRMIDRDFIVVAEVIAQRLQHFGGEPQVHRRAVSGLTLEGG